MEDLTVKKAQLYKSPIATLKIMQAYDRSLNNSNSNSDLKHNLTPTS